MSSRSVLPVARSNSSRWRSTLATNASVSGARNRTVATGGAYWPPAGAAAGSARVQNSGIRSVHVRLEADERHPLDRRVRPEEAARLADRHRRGGVVWVAVGAAADRGEGDRAEAVPGGQLEAGAVAGGERLGLSVLAASPNGTDRVYDVASRQGVTGRDARLAGRAPAEQAAFIEQSGAGGAVDGPVHAAAAEQRGVGGVDDRVDTERRDVAPDELQPIGHPGIVARSASASGGRSGGRSPAIWRRTSFTRSKGRRAEPRTISCRFSRFWNDSRSVAMDP